MTDDILKPLPNTRKTKVGATKPLTALQVKQHSDGILADTHPHQGLRLRATKTGAKTWFYRYRIGNKLKQIKLGSYPGMELAEAREAYRKQKRLREQGEDPQVVAAAKKREFERAEFTFAVMVEEYLTDRVEKDRKAKGAAETRRLLENDLGTLANRKVSEVAPVELHHHIKAIAERAPNIALNFRAELARAWRFAVNTGKVMAACPINSDMGGQLRQRKRERHLSQAELKLLLPWLKHYSVTVRDALILTLYLGLRSGEVCKLRDQWLAEESDGWWITIPAGEMKRSHSDHRVPLSGSALDIVKRRSGKGYWFPSRSKPFIDQKVLGVEVYAYSGKSTADAYKNKPVCPVSNWAPNDLRKTARTLLAAMGCPFEVGESVLHHRLPGVGGLYNQHRYDAEKRAWLTELGQFLDKLNCSNEMD